MELMLGQGSSLIICIGILKGYSETLLKMLMVLQSGSTGWGPSIFVFLGVFLVMTMWAVLDTEGRRKIKMVYDNFELAPTKAKADVGLQEMEPYIPFNINPTGMQPVLITTYLMAVPSLVAPGAGFGIQFMARASPLAMSLLLWVWVLILPVQAAPAPSLSPASNGTGVEPKLPRTECTLYIILAIVMTGWAFVFIIGTTSICRQRHLSTTAALGTPVGGAVIGTPVGGLVIGTPLSPVGGEVEMAGPPGPPNV